MSAKFAGFPSDYFQFFRDLGANNNREWFQASKDRYKASVQQPLMAFIEAMDVPLGRVSECFLADPRPVGGSMFRIYRDVRFSKDKSPYKEHGACQFRHMAGKDAHAPGFYVHLAPGEVFFGGGIWMPPSPVLRRVREAIAERSDRWLEIIGARTFRKRFGEVRGDALKRPPQGFDPEHPAIEDLKRKSFFAMAEADEKTACSAGFVREVARSFEALAPFMELLTEAAGHRFSIDD